VSDVSAHDGDAHEVREGQVEDEANDVLDGDGTGLAGQQARI